MAIGKQKGLFRSEAGQILLVVVLVVIVVTTIGLSLASRSITSLRTSTEEAESQKALAAAEAGVERLLENSAPTTEGTIVGSLANANYSATVSAHQLSATTFLMNGGNSVPKDEGADLWFTVYSSDPNPANRYQNPWNGTINVYWGTDSSDPCNNPALEIIVITGTVGNPVSKRYAFDSCLSRRNENNFSAPSGSGGETIEGTALLYGSGPIIVPGGLIARVVPLYGNTAVGVDGGATALPLQGSVISSTGTSGQTNRKIRVFKGYPQTYLPYLSYGLFVATDK